MTLKELVLKATTIGLHVEIHRGKNCSVIVEVVSRDDNQVFLATITTYRVPTIEALDGELEGYKYFC